MLAGSGRLWPCCLLCFSLQALAVDCDLASVPATGTHDNVAVVVNVNSPASCEVGKYYAMQRGVPAANIIKVKTPTNYFIDWTQFTILRDQILRGLLQRAALNSAAVSAGFCAGTSQYYCTANVDAAALHAGIDYLVLTTGVPTRTTVTGSDALPGSVDSYLRVMLAKYYDSPPERFDEFYKWPAAPGGGNAVRSVNPTADEQYVVGRIDGVDAAAAEALVDRSLAAEQNGLYGRAYYQFWDARYSAAGDVPFDPLRAIADWSALLPLNQSFFDITGATGGASANRIHVNIEKGVHYNSAYYPQALFGETDPACYGLFEPTHYLNIHDTANAGWTSPTNCRAPAQELREPPPSMLHSRQPKPFDALVYLGGLDGQPTVPGYFNGVLRWRRDNQCTATLCAAGDTNCRAASTDVFREIDTRCVGVADGFMGYNMQSFPLSYLAIWPTAWAMYTSGWNKAEDGSFLYSADGDYDKLAFPWIREDDGVGDSESLWFGNDAVPGYAATQQQCYPNAALNDQALIDCADPAPANNRLNSRNLMLQQDIDLAATQTPVRTTAGSAYKHYRLSFDIKVISGDSAVVLIPLLGAHPAAATGAGYCRQRATAQGVGQSNLAVTVDSADYGVWLHHEVEFELNPAVMDCIGGLSGYSWTDGQYDGLVLQLFSGSGATGQAAGFMGQVGLDNISLVEVGEEQELLTNGDFSQGHHQVASGDHAATFLSRLNGVAFWGSVGHHLDSGHAMGYNLELMRQFWRGMPLGDAVWFWNYYMNGMFYGDPLFSPVQIRLRTPATVNRGLAPGTSVPLYVSTINGRNPSGVTTTYVVKACYAGNSLDLYACDRNQSWGSALYSGSAAISDAYVGDWSPSANLPGYYLLRLSVTTTRTATGEQQTFTDHLALYYYKDRSDLDGDSVPDVVEQAYGGTFWWPGEDNDGDTISDIWETIFSQCLTAGSTDDPAADPDQDQLTTAQELQLGKGLLNPCSDDLHADDDGDGVVNLLEVLRGSDPYNAASVNTNAASDYDGDGIPDVDELQLQTDVLKDSRGIDSDGDGRSDAAEYRMGTDPHDPNDFPASARKVVIPLITQ